MNEILRNKEQALRDTLEKYNTKSYFNPCKKDLIGKE